MRVMVVGGFARSLVNFRGRLLKDLLARGHEVIAVASNSSAIIAERLEHLGVEYREIPLSRSSLNPIRDLRTAFSFYQLFRVYKPDIVLAYTIKPVIWAGIAARLAGIQSFFPMITGLGSSLQLADSPRRAMVRFLVQSLMRCAIREAKAIFFQNPDDEREFVSMGLVPGKVKRIQINGSGVDLVKFNYRPVPEAPVFFLMARLLAEKGIREYREAARIVRAEFPAARFQLAGRLGEGPSAISEVELYQWIEGGDVEYLGELDDVRPALTQCRVFVLPSYYGEGTPRSILEAMATGRAIITADSPGCRETVVDGHNGFLVRSRDVQSLVQAIKVLLCNGDLAERMGLRSLEIARNKYDVNKVNCVILRNLGL